MPDPQDASPPNSSNLMRMRFGSPDDQAALARRLVDAAYIRSVLRNQSEKNKLDQHVQSSLKGGKNQSKPRPQVPPPALKTTPSKQAPLVPRPQLHPRHPEPEVRPGEAGDVLDALMGVPTVARAVESVKNSAINKLKSEWNQRSGGGKATLITQTVVIGGGAIAGTLSSKPGRKKVYDLLRDREISLPVPGVAGLQLQLKTGNEHKAMLMFDLAEFLR